MPARLDERVPEKGFAHPDDALEVFLTYVAESGFVLYPHQEEAILEVFAGNHVVLDAPTGSGKSLVALALHFKSFVELGRSWYTAPIKALVSEKFFALCGVFGPEHVGMLTGDGAINRNAPIICCTAEILANLALREGEAAPVASVVMDEFHYYGDRDRGWAWQVPLLTLPRSTFLLMSATLGDTQAIRDDLAARTGRVVADVRGAHRPVPLHYRYSTAPLSDTLSELVRGGQAPVYLVFFTQNDASEQAQALMSIDWCTKEEKRAITEAIAGFRFTTPFGPTLRRFVAHGIGLHHAGLLPRYRLLVERLTQQGLLKVVCGTDTLGVGINVPIRTVLFTQLCKYDGEKVDILRVREFKQIAGRAGRAGFDTVGYVVAQAPAHIIENLRLEQKVTDPKKRRKIVKAQPPAHGFRHWDESTFQRLVDSPAEPLVPRFSVNHGRLLMMLQHAADTTGDARVGYQRLLDLIDRLRATAAEKQALRSTTENLLLNLRNAHLLGEEDGHLVLDPTLPRDFSLHHSLSLFLLAAIETLDRASPTYPLDVLGWVEAILEDPRAVLYRQADRARFLKVQELKAAGVPYEDRLVALEDVSWPKPNAEEIYAFFNAYKIEHPWAADEPILPKSVAREMWELYASFGEYVKELGLQRVEGVLLRHLAHVYQVLVQNVPVDARTAELEEIQAWLRATLAVVDTSLLMEWEALIRGADAPAPGPPPKPDVSADRRAFTARVRAEMHALVNALSRGEWDEAVGCVAPGDDGRWDADTFASQLAPLVAEGGVRFDHAARLAQNTRVRPVGPHVWQVRQVLLVGAADPTTDEDEDGSVHAIEGRIDLRSDTNPDGPLVEILTID